MPHMEYMDELELKSLIIRIKNSKEYYKTTKTYKTITDNSVKSQMNNRKLNKYIRIFKNVKKLDTERSKKFIKDIKDFIIRKSEKTLIDTASYEYFGLCIIQMFNRIVTIPQFRSYSYYDEFLSDSTYKILKYIDNFDHKKISDISGQQVNAFSYVTTIIYNSILYIINKNKKYNDFIHEQIIYEKVKHDIKIGNHDLLLNNSGFTDDKEETNSYLVSSETLDSTIDEIKNTHHKNDMICITYLNLELEEFTKIYELKKTFKNIVLKEISDGNE